MNNDKFVDKTLDFMLETVAPEVAEKVALEILSEIDLDEEVEFSEEHNKRMRKFFNGLRRKALYKKLYFYSKRVAVVLLVAISVFGVSLVSVRAWRIRALNFFIEISDSYSDIKFVETDNPYRSNSISLEYMPIGFVLEESEETDNSIYLKFVKGDDYFRFSKEIVDSKMRVDTENSNIKELQIQGRKAFYSENDNVSILMWHDDVFAYALFGTISESEMILIAENIK